MNHTRLRFALAVNQDSNLEIQHFGAASNFLLFEFKEDSVNIIATLENPYQRGHGSHQPSNHPSGHDNKASLLIPFLKQEGVHILVSSQFGANIKKVIEHFVPVLTSQKTKEGIFNEISDQLDVIENEWKEHAERHQVLRIMEGKVIRIPVKR